MQNLLELRLLAGSLSERVSKLRIIYRDNNYDQHIELAEKCHRALTTLIFSTAGTGEHKVPAAPACTYETIVVPESDDTTDNTTLCRDNRWLRIDGAVSVVHSTFDIIYNGNIEFIETTLHDINDTVAAEEAGLEADNAEITSAIAARERQYAAYNTPSHYTTTPRTVRLPDTIDDWSDIDDDFGLHDDYATTKRSKALRTKIKALKGLYTDADIMREFYKYEHVPWIGVDDLDEDGAPFFFSQYDQYGNSYGFNISGATDVEWTIRLCDHNCTIFKTTSHARHTATRDSGKVIFDNGWEILWRAERKIKTSLFHINTVYEEVRILPTRIIVAGSANSPLSPAWDLQITH